MNIQSKIDKYTYKLQNSKSKKEADIYQKKLKKYHTINKHLMNLDKNKNN